jgi:hypothetical protein
VRCPPLGGRLDLSIRGHDVISTHALTKPVGAGFLWVAFGRVLRGGRPDLGPLGQAART